MDVVNEKLTKINTYCNYISSLTQNKNENTINEELQEINENLESIINIPQFTVFFKHALPIILDYLSNGLKIFILEHSGHQIRKSLLELLSRLPFSETRHYLGLIYPVMYNILEQDNEDNAAIALRILTETHKKSHPQKPTEETRKFLDLLKKILQTFFGNAEKIFEPRPQLCTTNLQTMNIEVILNEIYTSTPIKTEMQSGADGSTFTILPRGLYSIKLLSEIPLSIIFLYQIYKPLIDQDILEILPLGMRVISLQADLLRQQAIAKANATGTQTKLNTNTEIYVEFLQLQVKFLSMISFMVRGFEDKVHSHIEPDKMPVALLNLLKNCPHKVPMIRKDILYSTRYIIGTRYRAYFAPYIEQFFDETVLIGNGWTTRETLRSLGYSVIYDLLHHIRDQLPLKSLNIAINLYSKNLYDESLSMTNHIMSVRLLQNLTDSFQKLAEKENCIVQLREILLKIFEVFANKIRAISKFYIPAIRKRLANSSSSSSSSSALPLALPQPSSSSQTNSQSSNGSVTSTPIKIKLESTATEIPTTPGGTTSTNNGTCAGSTADPSYNDNSERISKEDLKLKFGFPEPQSSIFSVQECRLLAKTLVNGLKLFSVKLKEFTEKYETNNPPVSTVQNTANGQQTQQVLNISIKTGFCRPRDIAILIRLFRNGLKLFDLYNLAALKTPPTTTTTTAASTGSSESGSNRSFGQQTAGGAAASAPASAPPPPPPPPVSHSRTKEEKEVMEYFAHIFTSLSPQTFRVVMSETIEYFVECINENYNVQSVANSFLAALHTSPIFANVLVEFLLTRMEVMGNNTDLSNLYLKLFKLVFGSVSLFPSENEIMLKPHLHKIVNSSMQMALNAKEPFNYFLLLRALFRSIGGGSHDLLYQEFLPMLPSLLQGLNSLQSGIHRQNMKDLFVELCLTIPVRLSSLLPYLPWLMDPLVSALNGTQNLIAQGLRTLELCVDNLQPDFLYEHIQPIRTELMQALWRTLRHPAESVAQVSFRILGKLGGSNHKLMIEPQKLDYIDFRDSSNETGGYCGSGSILTDISANIGTGTQAIGLGLPSNHGAYSFVAIHFGDIQQPVSLPIDRVIETAYRGLRLSTTDSYYRHQCWEVIKGFFVAHIQHISKQDDRVSMHKLFAHKSFTNEFVGTTNNSATSGGGSSMSGSSAIPITLSSSALGTFYKFHDEKLRRVHELAITGMITAAAIKELYNTVIIFMIPLVRHYTLVAISQQTGPIHCQSSGSNLSQGSTGSVTRYGGPSKLSGMDPLVLIDAVAGLLGQEEKELSKPCVLILKVIRETTISVMGSLERACQLPLYEYILERVCALCYERAWFSKHGGCIAVCYLFQNMTLRWLFRHQFVLLKAMFFVMNDLSGDLSSGVMEMAKDNLETMIKMCATPIESSQSDDQSLSDLEECQRKSMNEVTEEFLRQLTSPNTTVREHAMHLLQILATTTGKTVTEVMEPHKELLADMVPPKKHKLLQQAVNVQIGLLDGNTFCITLEPRLFTIDITIAEHLNFFNDVYSICDSDDAQLQKYSCYKTVESLVPLRKSALRALAACHYLPTMRSKIFVVLYKALNSSNTDLQECAYQCMDRYKVLKDVNSDLIRTSVRSFLVNINDYRTLNQHTIQRLKYLARLFTYIFNDRFCDQMLQHLIRITDTCANYLRKHRERELKFKAAIAAASANNNSDPQVALDAAAAQHHPALSAPDISEHLRLCAAIINLFNEISASSKSYIEHLLNFLHKTENNLDTYASMKFYEPIRNFFKRYPKESIELLEKRMNEECVFRFYQYLLSGEDGSIFREIIQNNPEMLISTLKNSIKESLKQQPPQTEDSNGDSLAASKLSSYSRYQTIRIISILLKYEPNWLSTTNPELISLLRTIWLSESFHLEHQNSFRLDYKQWSEPKLLVKCLLSYFVANQDEEIELIFQLLRAFNGKYHCDFEFLRNFLQNSVMLTYSFEWKRVVFFKFVEIFQKIVQMIKDRDSGTSTGEKASSGGATSSSSSDFFKLWPQELISKVLQYLIIPAFSNAFETGNCEALVGQIDVDGSKSSGFCSDVSDASEDLMTVFICRVICADEVLTISHLEVSDCVHIYVLQLACILVENAWTYISVSNKRQDTKVRRLMSYAWPCLLTRNDTDPSTKYYCHLLLAHVIAKFAIHKKIVRQVFHSLLKANSIEAKAIVRNALEILIPSLIPTSANRNEDGNKMLTHWTKKLIIEEGHSPAQLIHMLQLIVRNYRLYFMNRHIFLSHMVSQIQRLGFTQTSTVEHRKIALDMVEVIIRWEHQRVALASQMQSDSTTLPMVGGIGSASGSSGGGSTPGPNSTPNQNNEISMEVDGAESDSRSLGGGTKSNFINDPATNASVLAPIEKEYQDAIIAFLIRFICIIHDLNNNGNAGSLATVQHNPLIGGAGISAEYLCRRAISLLKNALQLDIWPNSEFKVLFLERILSSAKDSQPNYLSICMALELLTIFLQTMKPEAVLHIFISLQKAIAICCTCTNSRVVRTVNNLLTKLMALFPPSCASTTISPKSGAPIKVVNQDQLEPLEQLYTEIHSIILNGFGAYDKATTAAAAAAATATGTAPGAVVGPGGGATTIGNRLGPGGMTAAAAAHLINSTTSTLSQLFGTLMILKAACVNHPSYIDRLLTPFMHMLQKLVKEHLHSVIQNGPGGGSSANSQNQNQQQPQNFNATLCIEIIILSLELVKNRLGAMSQEMRRSFITNVFIGLIDKSPEVKIMKTILKIFEEWIKQPMSTTQHGSRASSGTMHHSIAPVLREKAQLLIRIAHNIEKRFGDNQELNAVFLELIHYIYSDDTLKSSDLCSKLEFAFMAGLRCVQAPIRNKFFHNLDSNVRKRLYDRLMYIMCSQNWETIGPHFWIKQCIELVLAVTDHNLPLTTLNPQALIPLPTSLVSVTGTDHGGGGDKWNSYNFGDSGSSINPTDMLMDFDFIGSNFGDVVMADISDTKPNTSTNGSNLDHSAHNATTEANTFLSDFFGSCIGSSPSVVDVVSGGGSGSGSATTTATTSANPKSLLQVLSIVCNFLQHLSQSSNHTFISAVAQLCHLDNSLAQHVWIHLFPRIYSVLPERQQRMISLQVAQFLLSGSHSPQRDAPLSAIGTFFEAVVQCEPPITLHPEALKYLSRNHNVWHRSALLLETTLDRIQSIPNCQSLYLSGLVSLLGPGAAPSGVFALPTPKTSTRGSSGTAATPAGTTPGGDAAVVSTAATGPLPTSIHEIFPVELQLNNGPTYADLCSSALCNVYEFLKEEDYWAGIWHRRAKYPETLIAISYEQQGNFERAKSSYELVMGKAREDFSQKPAPYSQNDEITLWERRWIRCSKELNQWDFLLEYGNTPDGMNPLLVLESAWRIPDWDQMNHAIFAVESNLPKDVAWKVALYKGYNAICNSANRDLDIVERMVELASNFLIKEWRRLPHLVSAVHIDILHAAHQVIELQEAARLHQGLFNPAGQSHSPGSFCANNNSIERVGVDLRAVIKTWKNRLPVLSDDLSHWSDIFTWRQHHYQTIVSRFESEANRSTSSGSSSAASGTSSSVNSQAASQNALLGAHASAQSLIHYAKIARKHFLPNVSLESLNRIHTIPRVPIIDCFQKIRQQLKCYLLLHHIQPNGDELQEGLSVIESTHLKYFQREMISEFYAMKGYFQMKLGQMDEAKLSFSTAAQIQDTLVKAWALWGEYHDQLFTDESVPFAQRDMEHGVQAIISYLHACRHQNEAKSRKYLSKVLWLLSYDDDSHTLAQAAERYNTGVPTVNWLPWVPQLLQCLIRTEGNLMMGIVLQVSKLYPQAVYFPIRTIFLTQKMEQRDMKYKTMMMSNAAGAISGPGGQIAGSEQMVLATAGMMRCSRIMHQMRDINPTILTVLEGIVDQLTWFRENWYEEVLRQLRQVLVKCYTVAFENRANVSDTPIPQHTFNFFRKLVANFGIGIDNASAAAAAAAASAGGGGGQQRQSQQQQLQQSQSDQQTGGAGPQRNIRNINTTASESLAKRAQATAQDPIFQKLKVQFTNDFDFSVPGSKKLHNLIGKLKKWIKILEAKTKLFPKSWLLEEKCRYLSNFSQHTVDVSLPGEYLLPKLGHISIARFMPRVEIVTKHNTAARRLYIRGHNGKIYPYLVLNDSPLSETRREERLLQLLRLLNLYLTKHKETARRLLYFTVPRVVPITPQMRFVEDNPSSLSLVEIYKQHVIRRGSDPDAPIAKYYDRLLSVQTKGSQVSLPTLRDIVSDIQSSMAPRTLLREWALLTYSGATDFWHFRKLFTQQLALAGISEFALYLTRLNPDMMYVHRDSGLMNIAYYRFDLNEESGELASTQPVPFRLAYSMANLITETGILGPLTATMISSASCLVHPNYKVRSILFAILRDEIISWYKRQKTNEKMVFLTAAAIQAAQAAQAASASGDETKNSDSGGQLSQQQQQQQQLGRNSQQANAFSAAISASQQEIPEMNREELVNLVTKAVNAIMSRLQSLATFEGSDSKVATLIADATNQDNLCQMDPAWHPWL